MGACFRDRVRCTCLLVAALATLVLVAPSFAKITFERTYGGMLTDRGYSVQQTSDGGYIITGIADMGGQDKKANFYLIKTDSLGDTLWSRVYGSDSIVHMGFSVRQTLDGGYIVVGANQASPFAEWDVYLLKTDPQGETEWEKTYGGDRHDVGMGVQQTSDGGYIIVGFTDSFAPDCKVYLVKTDAAGNVTWWMIYGGGSETTSANCVEQTSDEGYIVAGTVYRDLGPHAILLIKTNSAGLPVWEKAYDMSPEADRGMSVQQTTDGGYVVAGYSGSWLDSEILLLKTDQSGEELWSRTYGRGFGVDRGHSVRQTFDGGYVIAGISELFGTGDKDVYLIRTDSLGGVLWDTTFGGPGWDGAHSVQQTTDSGYVIAGGRECSGCETGRDVYLIKTNERGRIAPMRDYGIASLDSPPDTVFPDSMYEVTATMANYGNVIDSLYITASINGYTDTLRGANVAPSRSMQVHFANWQVPPADSSSYTMRVCTHVVGDVDTTNDCMSKTIFAYDPTGVEEDLGRRPRVVNFRLSQNEPNPFCRSTVIRYSLPAGYGLSLKVYDLTGRVVETLVAREQGPGVYQVKWDAKDQTSGIYFYRLKAGGFTDTKQMILLW